MTENINWYPGHMKKTKELIQQNLKLIDAVIEVIDARIPVSGRNPMIDGLIRGKSRIVVLNKSDLADERATALWIKKIEENTPASKNSSENKECAGSKKNEASNSFAERGTRDVAKSEATEVKKGEQTDEQTDETAESHETIKKSGTDSITSGQNTRAIATDCMSGAGIKSLFSVLKELEKEQNSKKQLKRPYRVMIVGVPNTGKSSLINRMTGKKSAKTGNKPGITRGKQWLKLQGGMQLLDTPGILWPRFEDPGAGVNLAFCGCIKDEILDVPELALELVKVLSARYPELLIKRYKLDSISDTPLETMENIAEKRGCILSGGRIDYERTGHMLLDEFRSSRIGRITLEWPN